MVERYRRKKKRRKNLLGNHQKSFIWGRNVVLETLRACRWPPLQLHLADRLPEETLVEIRALADDLEVPVAIEPFDRLTDHCHSREHQGFLARMPRFPYDDFGDVLKSRHKTSLFAILDSVQDPHNFGAILRSADVLGVDAVIVGTSHQVEVTSLVARSSAGAVNHVKLATVDDLTEGATALKASGFQIVGTQPHGDCRIDDYNFCVPTAIIIGNEGTGIRPELLRVCDRTLTIPQIGTVESLNAAVSAGILFYEACRQKSLHLN